MRIAALLLALCAACVPASTLEERIREAIESSAEARQGFLGIRVVDAATGSAVYSENENRFFVPASNTKLFTTALALERLGPDYRFQTIVEADAPPDAQGRVRELRIVGGGDPNLSARVVPYSRESQSGANPLAAIEELAGRIVARGIRAVSGDIVGDDTAYVWEPFPNGWSVDDPVWEYGAPVSALTVNDNAFTLWVAPGASAGAPASIRLQPALEWLTIHNRTQTVAEGTGRLRYERLPGSRELVVAGTIGLKGGQRSPLLAIDDPALFAAYALRDALLERGVSVGGRARAVHRSAGDESPRIPGFEVARRESAPLAQIVQVINKVSQNLHAELVLREVARRAHGIGSREAGLKELEAFLTGIGVEEKQYRFEDASGLSRLTLVTPLTVAKLLVHAYNTPHREVWLSSLPIGGADGTLSLRFDRQSRSSSIRAKTGSISHVSSLSGYAFRDDGRVYAFSILANNYNSEHTPVRRVIDRIALALLE